MLLLASLANSFSMANAQPVPVFAEGKNTAGIINFIGTEGDMLVFELKLSNLPKKGSMVRILDGELNSLFEQKIYAVQYQVRYKIPRGEMTRISFEVSGKQFFINQAFSIGSKTEEQVIVSRS